MLKFGARRLRASKLAGQMQIPAYVNETAASYDQVIENEQREGLKPLEPALFVQRSHRVGRERADCAARNESQGDFGACRPITVERSNLSSVFRPSTAVNGGRAMVRPC